jgi:hypothetical protein
VQNQRRPCCGPSVSFHFLAEHYLKAEFGVDALRPKSVNTIQSRRAGRARYLVPRFGTEIAEDIKPLDIQRWLKSLHDSNGLAWTTISKMRGIMHRIYKIGILHEHVTKNPVLHVETRSKTDYKPIIITPQQTLAILKALPSPLHFTAGAYLCGDRAPCIGDARAALVRHLWSEGRIRISKRWAKGKDGETKTEASDGYVPMHPVLSAPGCALGGNKAPMRKTETLCFRRSEPGTEEVPLSASVFVAEASASGRKESRGADRGRTAVRASQSSPLT